MHIPCCIKNNTLKQSGSPKFLLGIFLFELTNILIYEFVRLQCMYFFQCEKERKNGKTSSEMVILTLSVNCYVLLGANKTYSRN